MNRPIHSSSFVLTLAIFLSIYSCASLREWIIGRDNFSRTYAVDFMSFHPKLNSALQDYARKQKGSSFQVIRLGNDAVIIQGFYRGEQEQDRFPSTVTANPRAQEGRGWKSKFPRVTQRFIQNISRNLPEIFSKLSRKKRASGQRSENFRSRLFSGQSA